RRRHQHGRTADAGAGSEGVVAGRQTPPSVLVAHLLMNQIHAEAGQVLRELTERGDGLLRRRPVDDGPAVAGLDQRSKSRLDLLVRCTVEDLDAERAGADGFRRLPGQVPAPAMSI